MYNKYDFNQLEKELDKGFQVYCTYVRNRYLIFKTTENCYTQKLLSDDPKNPQPRMAMITKKRLKEIFPYLEDIEYKVGIPEI